MFKNNLSLWFSKNNDYKLFIYEDIFIRKYIVSFLSKFNKKVIGSIYIFRTHGKLYIKLFYFSPFNIQLKKLVLKKRSLVQKVFSLRKVRPINKYKKQLLLLKLFFNLEKVLNYQIYYRFINIFNLKKDDKKFIKFCYYKLRKYRVSNLVFFNTGKFLVNLFSFKVPDSFLLASFLSYNLCSLVKHTGFLMFFVDFLKILLIFYKHIIGIKIIVSGKLNSFSRAQVRKIQLGQVSLQTVSVKNVYGFSEAFTKFGKLGIKVWILYRV